MSTVKNKIKNVDLTVYTPLDKPLAETTVVVFGHGIIKDHSIGTISRVGLTDTALVYVKVGHVTYSVPKDMLYTRKPVAGDVSKAISTLKVPANLRRAAYFTKNTKMFIYGHKDYKDGTPCVVDAYMQPTSKFIAVMVNKKVQYIEPANLYIIDPQYVTPIPLFSELKEPTDLQEYMAKLLYADNMDDSITLALEDVDLSKYDMISSQSGSKWAAIIPKGAKGPMPVLMAHCDIQMNVKHPTEKNLTYDEKLSKFNSPTGLGADDRAGLFVINRALNMHEGKFIAIFFDEEEVGCKGSRNFVKSKDFKEKIDPMASLYISIDRTRSTTGGKTVATYGHDNKAILGMFKDKLKRPEVRGSSTDCKVLSAESVEISKDNMGIACVNFSCGYQFEHTSRETLYWKELLECAIDICAMPEKMPTLWKLQYRAEKPAVSYGGYYGRGANTTTKAKTKPKAKVTSTLYADDYILVNGDYYDSDDVEALLKQFKHKMGREYVVGDAGPYTPKRNDFVRLSTSVSIGGIYGGQRLDKATYIMLDSNVWIVHSVDHTTASVSLRTDDASYDAVNIPMELLEAVTQSDMLVSQNLLEN